MNYAAVTALLLICTAQALAPAHAEMKMHCEAEFQAQEAIAHQLTDDQRRALSNYRNFNTSATGRYAAGMDLVREHLDNNPSGRPPDDGPVSACLLKVLADGNREKSVAPLAQEAYGLRLLAGSGVPRDREQGIEYLQRAANWGYASAAAHLGKLYLADAKNPQSKAKAVAWLEFAAMGAGGESAVGGWSAGPERPINLLFKLHISAKDWAAAEQLYRNARDAQYSKDSLAVQLLRIPGLKARIDAEDEARAQALAEARRRAMETSRQTKTCITYRSGFKHCS